MNGSLGRLPEYLVALVFFVLGFGHETQEYESTQIDNNCADIHFVPTVRADLVACVAALDAGMSLGIHCHI